MRNKIIKKILPQNFLKDKIKFRNEELEFLEQYKHKLQDILDKQYQSHESENLKFYERELNIRNHKGYICGYYDDDYSAADYLIMRLEERYPNGIILCDFSKDDFDYCQYGSAKYDILPRIEPITEQCLLGRQMFLNFFKNEMKYSLRYFKDFGDYTIAEMDRLYRRKILNINLSLGYWACFKDDIRIIIGAPQKLLVLEDLAVSLELRELKNIFNETIKNFVELGKDDIFEPSLNIIEFYISLRDVAKDKYAKILYEKKNMYSASVVRKVHKLFNDNMIVCDNDLVNNLFRHAIDENNPEFTNIFRDEEFFRLLENIDSSEEGLKVILEKIIILNHLYDREFRNYIDHNINPIKGLFGKKFDHFEDSYVINLYRKINSYYAKILETLLFNDIKRLEKYEGLGRFYLKTYSVEIKKIEEQKGYSFLIDKDRKINELKFIFKLLLAQISINIINKEKEGKDMSITKIELKKLFNGIRTKQNLKLYNELLIEANTQLGLLKFPETFAKNFTETMKTVSYSEMKNLIGEDPMTKFENAQIALNNQMRGIDPMYIKEGWEHSMKTNLVKQESIIDLPNKLLTKYINESSEKKNNTEFGLGLFKDNSKLFEMIQSEYDNRSKDQEDVEETSEVIVIGQGTEKERHILSKDIKEKSVEELKAMGFEEITAIEMKLDDEGNLKTQGDNISPELAKKLEDEYRLSEVLGNSEDLYENRNKNKNFQMEMKKLVEIISEQDDKKINKIMTALETGEEVNDPIYYTMILEKKEWLKNRVNYLKKHFKGEINEKTLEKITYEKHIHLYEKYDPDSNDLEDTYLKFMSPEEKKYTLMLRKEYMDSQENNEHLNDIEEAKLFEDDDDQIHDYRSFIGDRIKELKRDDIGKKNYDYDREKEIEMEDDKINLKYIPGSSRRNLNKKIRKL